MTEQATLEHCGMVLPPEPEAGTPVAVGSPESLPNTDVLAALTKIFLAGLPNGITKLGFWNDGNDPDAERYIEVECTPKGTYEVYVDGDLHAVVGMSVQYYETVPDMSSAEQHDADVPTGKGGIIIAEPPEGAAPDSGAADMVVPDLANLSNAKMGEPGDSAGSVNKRAKAAKAEAASKDGSKGDDASKKKTAIRNADLGA